MQKTIDDIAKNEVSVIRIGTNITSLRTTRAEVPLPSTRYKHPLRVQHLSIFLICGILAWGVIIGIHWAVDLSTAISNTVIYGPNRTSVVSGTFGHNNDSVTNPTLVVAINAKGSLLIESLPAGDVSKAKIYPTGLKLVGPNAEKLPVILTIKDLNGDYKPDVLVEISDQKITLMLINTGTDFTLTR